MLSFLISQFVIFSICPYKKRLYTKSTLQRECFFIINDRFFKGNQPPNWASMVPAATAVPITPATLGPMACMSR